MKFLAADTESSYTKTRDIKSLGVAGYVRHPETDHYLVSVCNGDEAIAAPTTKFNWACMADYPMWTAHNCAYDSQVLDELRRRGVGIPRPQEMNCTADLSAFLQSPRSLVDASRELLGVTADKSVRDEMRGKNYHELSDEDKARWGDYAKQDAILCYRLWKEHSHLWPEHERAASRHTAMMGARGIGVDTSRMDRFINTLQHATAACTERIPWAECIDAKGDPVPLTSPKEIKAECARRGIAPPTSTDAKSEEFEAWLEENETQADFIQAVQEFRRANRLLKILEQMRTRTVDERLRQGLMYFGAPHTGHWTGGGGDETRNRNQEGLNMLNLPRDPLYVTNDFRIINLRTLDAARRKEVKLNETLDGKPLHVVNVRTVLSPGEDKRIVVADWNAVQARIVRWLAKDTVMLNHLRNGMDIYEAHARASMGYTDPRPLKDVDRDKRQFAKMRELQLGFGCGPDKFKSSAKTQYQVSIDRARAAREVNDYRAKNPKVVACWKMLEEKFRQSRGGVFETELPSGRVVHYWDVARSTGGKFGVEYTAKVKRGGDRIAFYGGKLFQNVVAGVGRDLLADAVLRIEAAGVPVVLHVHDEPVMEVAAKDAVDAAETVRARMRELPEWASDLPIEGDVHILPHYCKPD